MELCKEAVMEESSREIHSLKTRVGDWVIVAICVLIAIICLLPMVNLLARSLSGTDYLIKNEVYLWPKGFNIKAYATVLSYAHSSALR